MAYGPQCRHAHPVHQALAAGGRRARAAAPDVFRDSGGRYGVDPGRMLEAAHRGLQREVRQLRQLRWLSRSPGYRSGNQQRHSMTTRAQIVAEAWTWIDTPYAHQQSAKGSGADCVGFIKGVAQACGLYRGLVLPPYHEQPDPDEMRALLLQHLDPIAYRSRQPGDILHFRSELDGVARHLGLIITLEPHFILHAWRRKLIDKVTRTRIDKFWRIDGCYALRGLDD